MHSVDRAMRWFFVVREFFASSKSYSVGETLEEIHFDTKKLKIDFNELTNATRATFFPKYCDKMRSFVSCIDRSLMFMELCHSSSTIHIGKALIESISAVSNLACKNDGEIIFHEEHKECIMQKEDEISACFNTFKKIRNGIIHFTELTQDQCRSSAGNLERKKGDRCNLRVPLQNATEIIACDRSSLSILTNFRQCLKDQLDHCDLSDIISIYDVPMNAMLRLTPCGNHTEEQQVGLIESNSIVEV
ncbi:hypothetical protein AND_007110 [Anopheles darlingi]|uniref:Uncharacterized protein n=1 Tax=Anopheles darlingi TaxID=43151 RepID=W5J9U9_ANODA|nr:hypothetical protein AND_007110 [Anopheles darlingi]